MSPSRETEPATCARCGQPWREPHRAYLPGADAPVCMACFLAPDPHEAIDAIAHRRVER